MGLETMEIPVGHVAQHHNPVPNDLPYEPHLHPNRDPFFPGGCSLRRPVWPAHHHWLHVFYGGFRGAARISCVLRGHIAI